MLNKRGFSAVEILIVLTILGVLLALSMRFLSNAADLNRAASELELLMSKTRFEAIKRNRNVVLEFSANAVAVYVDRNGDMIKDLDDPILQGWKASNYPRGVRLSVINLGGGNLLVWSPEGRGSSVNNGSPAGRLGLVDNTGASRELTVSAGGYTN